MRRAFSCAGGCVAPDRRALAAAGLLAALSLPLIRTLDQRQGYPVTVASFTSEWRGQTMSDAELEREMARQGWFWELNGSVPADLTGLAWARPGGETPPLARAHALNDRELGTVDPTRLQARYERAVRERTVQVIVLRPLRVPGAPGLAEQRDALHLALRQAGHAVERRFWGLAPDAPGYPLEAGPTSWPWPLGLTGAQMMLLSALCFAGATGLLLAAAKGAGRLGPLAALAGVAWGAVRADGWEAAVISGAGVATLWLGGVALAWLGSRGRWWEALGAAVLSGLAAGSLLWAWWPYRLGALQPNGIRIALAFPVALAVAWSWRRAAPKGAQVLLALAGLLGLGALAAWALVRAKDTGWLFPYELDLRELLERVLPARPRTRELLGYPAMAWLLVRGAGPAWRLVLAGLATTALVTTQNTFLHATTPLVLNLTREGLGIGLGLVLPLLVVFALWGPRQGQAREAGNV